MKKSSPHVIIVSGLKKWRSPIYFFTTFILLLSGKTQAQSPDPFSRQSQFDLRILNSQAYSGPHSTNAHHESNSLQWETIQTMVIPQRDPNSPLPPTKFNLDQVRNGRGSAPENPAGWVNGNAGASNAHFVEGWSIPYRVNITDLAIGSHSLDIEWDIRHSGANAIDFVTNFDLINYPAPSSHLFNFGHGPETINPLTEVGTWVSGTSSIIPAPSLPAGAVTTYHGLVMAYSNASGDANKFSIWNGNITNMVLVTEGNLGAQQSATRMRIFFTNTDEDVIISWGGHIAKGEGVWGVGNSASAVEGSPYHTRLISWDPDGDGNNQTSIGNQDRSLSAAAVQDPPICNLNGPGSLECSAPTSFTSGVALSDLSQGVTFDWEIEGATNCGTVTLSNETVGSASVTTSSSCGCSFSVVYIILKNGDEISRCVKLITVTDTRAPAFTSSPSGSDLGCNPSGLPAPVNPSASDNCGTPTVTSSNGAITSNGCTRSQTRTYTATDACNNTATVGQTFTWTADLTGPTFTSCPAGSDLGCNPASIPEAGTATATDACGTPTITSSLGAEAGTGCSRSRTRTYTARDACGNSSTCQQVFTYVVDVTGPVFTFCPAGSNVGCNPASFPDPGAATATDACSTPTITSVLGNEVGTGCNRSKTRTYTAIDACGNSSTCQQTFTYTVDVTAPVFTSCPAGSDLGCNPASIPAAGTATATDACGTPTITSALADEVGTGCSRSRTRTYTARDACGNSSTCQQVFTYTVDITPPVFTACQPDVIVECGSPTSTAALGSATATDGCGSTTVTANDAAPLLVGCQTVIVRTWRARDACGNTATCVQRILVIDNTPPAITCNPDGSATATDCGSYYLYQNGTTWTAIDASGNIRTASCIPQAGRITTSQVMEEQQEQKQITVTEEKTVAPVKQKELIKNINVQAFPNPFSDQVKFLVTTSEAGIGSLEVYNMTGQKIKTVYTGYIAAGTRTFELRLPAQQVSNLVYVLKVGDKKVTGKILQMNR